MGEAALVSGDLNAADRHAKRATSLDARMSRAWLLQAEMAMMRAEEAAMAALWAEAESILRAYRADPTAPEPLAQNHRWFKRQKLTPTDLGFDGLFRAHRLVPPKRALRRKWHGR